MNLRCHKGTHALSTITNPDWEKLSDLSKEKDGHLAGPGAIKETLKGRIMRTDHGDVSAGQALPLGQPLPETTGVKIWAPVTCYCPKILPRPSGGDISAEGPVWSDYHLSVR